MAPHRGPYGGARPARLDSLALPPAPMPARLGLRPLKAWRYVGVFGPELMLCLAAARIGPVRQSFWAVWERPRRVLHQHGAPGACGVSLAPGRARVQDRNVCVELTLQETGGVETICPTGDGYAWTRKQGGIRVRGTVTIGRSAVYELDARAIVDDTAAYYERHTRWQWSAGIGTTPDGRELAWNLVDGVNDPASGSERTVWVDGESSEVAPVSFARDLSGVGGLRFAAEATREQRQNLLVVRSRYRQPFGTFTGELPDGSELAEGYGVMEEHDVWW